MAPALTVFVRLLGPVDRLFALWRALLSRLFPAHPEEDDIEEELMTMVDEARQEGDLDAHESDLLRSVIELQDCDAIDIMTPRVDITALPDTATAEEARALFLESEYSRVPVYHEDMDHIVGILHEKDLFEALARGETDIAPLMREPVYAPATLPASKLLKLFQSAKTHIAIVLDEFGGTEGLVTLEDTIEELVG